jgi:hypothetical protein
MVVWFAAAWFVLPVLARHRDLKARQDRT